jgi:AAA15 family ATPase/GTPase
MISTFKINNFRCFKDFEIGPLQRVNLIAGKNNSGKTSLLEGIYLYTGASDGSDMKTRLKNIRGLEFMSKTMDAEINMPWEELFYRFDQKSTISFTEICTDGNERVIDVTPDRDGYKQISLSYRESHGTYIAANTTVIISDGDFRVSSKEYMQPYLSLFLPSRLFHLPSKYFNELQLDKKEKEIVEVVKLVEPRLVDLRTLVCGVRQFLHGDIGQKRLMPLDLMGEGMTRICDIIISIFSASNGIVLIDEIENGIHYSIMEKVWTAIAEAARKFNVQVFATTHSWECIMAAHNAFKESGKKYGQYDFLYHRLDSVDGNIAAKTYDEESLDAAEDLDFEIR